ncbi:energy transducer TonB [Pleionea sp. CnH1-48]|uniref:energy transducer TonB n=1 Tax=Pleionea sp. CnH1-48 TaxID=2954494 RepID=UPI002097080C|nr:energy transducer TonB [Pleionea sp. CnH1-48]MCO7227412.1 energy transducer TonB [Pleionea sp. CnH1-48]
MSKHWNLVTTMVISALLVGCATTEPSYLTENKPISTQWVESQCGFELDKYGKPVAGSEEQNTLVPISTSPAPRYPKKAALEGIEGMVTMEFEINKEGSVSDVRVLYSNPHNVFEKAAVLNILESKFAPTSEDKKRCQLFSMEFNMG